MSDKFYAEVLKKANSVEGVMAVFDDQDNEIARWDVVLGNTSQKVSSEYGGPTPPLTWVMVETIETRSHPKSGSTFPFARIIPVGDKDQYHKRTFDLGTYPFMIHAAGRSTGCIAIKGNFSAAADVLNKCFKDCTFFIDVYHDEED